jgi:hypothetical protein
LFLETYDDFGDKVAGVEEENKYMQTVPKKTYKNLFQKG